MVVVVAVVVALVVVAVVVAVVVVYSRLSSSSKEGLCSLASAKPFAKVPIYDFVLYER